MTKNADADFLLHARLVQALRNPEPFQHPVDRVELIETHMSSVLLAGEFAYKLKKPVHFGWADFSTLSRRRLFCDEEVRLNRRTAPEVYLGVVAIAGTIDQPVIGGAGPILDYAVRMRRFPPGQLLDDLVRRTDFDATLIDRLAVRIARFHHALPGVEEGGGEGTKAEIWRWTHENFIELRRHPLFGGDRGRLDSLADWSRREYEACEMTFVTRRLQGMVRECHGDLHLGNVVVLDGEPVPFDCIEFNPALSWIDVINEIAFPFMDLFDHGRPQLAWRFLNRYLEVGGDYGGVAVLRFYAVYRAIVRAKVARLRMDAARVDAAQRAEAEAAFSGHIALAQALSVVPRRLIVLMHGVSGSGKSTVAEQLAMELGAIRIRSDAERKRLFGVALDESPPADRVGELYGAAATRRTYDRLALLATEIVEAGYPVIVDASFLAKAERARLRELARHRDAAFAVIDCTAPAGVLWARVQARAKRRSDPSDATVEIVERQLAGRQPLTDQERKACFPIATHVDRAALAGRCARLARELAGLVAP